MQQVNPPSIQRDEDLLQRLFQQDGERWLMNLETSNNEKFREVIRRGVDAYLSHEMPSRVMNWFAHRVDVDSAIRQRERESERKATEALGTQFTTHGEKLAHNYPQCFGSEALALINGPRLAASLPARFANPAAVGYEDLARMLGELIRGGKLIVDISVVLGGGTCEITGDELRQHPQLQQLMRSKASAAEIEQQRVNELSASEFLQEHPELRNFNTPPLVLASIKKNILTFISSNPNYRASEEAKEKLLAHIIRNQLGYSVQAIQAAWDSLRAAGELEADEFADVYGQITRLTDLGGKEKGTRLPAQPDRASFRRKVQQMSADEVALKIQTDPAFAKALDELGQ